jgi:hypothetical protein
MVESKEMSVRMVFCYDFRLLLINSYKINIACFVYLKVINAYCWIFFHYVKIFVSYFYHLIYFTAESWHKTIVNVWLPVIEVFFFVTISPFFFHLFVKAIQIDIDVDFTTFW